MTKKELFTSVFFVILLIVLSSTNNTIGNEIQVGSDPTKELENKTKPEIDTSKYQYSRSYLSNRILREFYDLDPENSDLDSLAHDIFDKYRSDIDILNWSDGFLSALIEVLPSQKKQFKLKKKLCDKIFEELKELDEHHVSYNDKAYEIFDKYRDQIEEYEWPNWFLEQLRALASGTSKTAWSVSSDLR